MSPAPTPLPPEAAYAAALEVNPAALTAAPAAPSEDEARAIEVVRAHLAGAHMGPAAFPSIAMTILDLVQFPDVDLNELSKYIRVDGALAGGVLALANSAIYRAVRRIDTVKEAVSRIGMSDVARLAAAIAMRSVYGPDAGRTHERYTPAWSRTFLHAVTVGRCASDLAKAKLAPTPGSEQAFMAGLLHDVGRAGALRALAELTAFEKIPALEDAAVGRVVQAVHLEAGVDLHRIWRLPPTLAEVAGHHHDAAPAGPSAPFIHLVRMVSALDLHRREPLSHVGAVAEVVSSARALGLPPERVKDLGKDLENAEAWVKTAIPG
ncbi:MAG: HDOD domain-containing protein [Anaeromyxobacter sp.]